MKKTLLESSRQTLSAGPVFFICLALLSGAFSAMAQLNDFNSRCAALLNYYDTTTPATNQTTTGEYRIGRTGFFFADARFLTNDLVNGSNFLAAAIGDADADGDDSGFSMWPAMDTYLRWNAVLPSVFTPAVDANLETQLTTHGTNYSAGTTPNQQMMLSTARYFAGNVWGTSSFPGGSQFQASYGTGDPTGQTFASNTIVSIPLYGMLEHDSPIYVGDTLGPIYTLAQFAPDPALQHKAQMAFDWIVAELSGFYFYDNWASAATRTFPYYTQNVPTETAFMSYLFFGGPTPANFTNSYLSASYCMTNLSFPGIPPEVLMAATNRTQPYTRYGADMEFTGLWNIGYYKTSYITLGYSLYSQAECDVLTNADGSYSITNFGTITTANSGEMQRWGVIWNDPAHQTKFWFTNPYNPSYSGSGGHYIGTSAYEETAQLGGTLVAVYNMPTNLLVPDWNKGGTSRTNYQVIEGSIPTNYLALIDNAATSGRIFLHYTNVLISLYVSTNFTWVANPGNTTYFQIPANIAGLAIETASPTDYTQSTASLRLAAFESDVLTHGSVNTNFLTGPNPAMIYTDRHANNLKIAFGQGAWTNGQLVDYQQWPTISNPWMYQSQLGNLFIFGTNRTIIYNYNTWTEATNNIPTLLTSNPLIINAATNATVDLDLATVSGDTETPSSNLLFTVNSPTNGTITLLPDGHTASFTPTTNYGGTTAGFSFTTTDYGIDPNLVLYYNFALPNTLSNNIISDVSGNARDASIVTAGLGAAAYSPSVPTNLVPFIGQSLQLPQDNNYVDAVCLARTVTTGNLSMTNGSWTFSTWFNRTTMTNDNFIFYAGTGSGFGGNGDELQLYCPSNANLIALSHWNASNVKDITIAPTNAVGTNAWHHVAVVVQYVAGGTNNVNLYLDGALVGTASNIVWALHQDYPLVFGGHNSTYLNLSRWFNGMLDDLALFRGALSSNDVARLATRTVSHFGGWTVTNGVTVWVGPLSPITLTTGDTSGSSSFNTAGNWNSGAAPAYTNAYFTSNYLLRTPPGSGNYNFAGNSLTVTNGGQLSLKGNGMDTINNLIMAGGTIAQGETGANPDTATLAGNINLTTSTTITSATRNSQLTLDIQASITNAPGVNAILTLSDAAMPNGLIVNLAGTNTFNGSIVVAGSPGDTLQLGANYALPVTAPLTLGGGSAPTNATILDLNGHITFISNLAFSSANYPGFVTNSSATPGTLAISNNTADLVQYGVIADNGALGGTLSLLKTGSGTLTLSNANTYSGSTTISNGTLALTSTGSINNSSNIVIAAGGTFDVSAFNPYTFNANLSAGGTASAATIKGASGGTVNLGSHTITLAYDGSHPALTISLGILVLNGNAFVVNGPVLTNGTYTLVQQTVGNITHTGTFTVSGTATGPGSGNLDSISVSGNKVTLTITGSTTTTCALAMGSNPSCYGDPLVFTATVANNGTTGTTPTGSVIFKDGTTPLFTNTLSGGIASYTDSALVAGPHSIAAYYQDDTSHNPSDSSTNPVSVVINIQPTITTQPTNLSIAVNNPATFSVTAGGQALYYQWYFNTNTPIPGATKPVFTLPNAAYTNAGIYSVVVYNTTCPPVTSSNVTLQVNTVETLIASDPFGTSSLTNTVNWTPSTTISPTNIYAFTNDYYTSGFNLRTPANTNGVNYTTQAKSLNITTGGTLSVKSNGTNTINNLVLAGGSLSQGETGAVPDIATVAGSINLLTSSIITSGAAATNTLTLIIQAPITNAPGINATLTFNDDVNNIYQGLIVVLAGQSTFNGNIIVGGSPGDTLQLGVNNALPATAPLTLNGVAAPTNTTVLDLNGYSTFISSLTFLNTNYPGYITNSSTTPGTLGISNNADDLVQYGVIADNGANGGTLSLLKTGSGSLILSNANTYSGSTTISNGTLALTSTGSINNSSNIVIAAGGTFDVSAITSCTISTNLSGSGTASAATLNGASGGTVSLGSHTVTLTYDGSDPALNISQGTLVLSNNVFIVNGPVLSNGTYTLVQAASSITHTGTLTLSGSAIPSSGTSNSISVSGETVTLTIVENTTTTCTLAMGSNPSCYGDPLVFTATVTDNGTTGTTPTGSVIFKDESVAVFTNTLSGGSANYTDSLPAAGSHSITAYYQGDTYHNTSNSSGTPLSQTVDAPPVITTQPVSMTNSSALTTATLSVVATGTPLSYQWYFNTNILLSGATSSSLTLTSTQMITNSGVYDVIVSSPSCEPATSSFAIFLITNNVETLKANDSVNTSSFTGTTNWTPATTIAPTNVNAFTNAYLTSTFLLRSPSGSANYNFAGYSLTVTNGGELSLKGYGTNTINNLIMAGGTIAQGVTGANPDIANLAGNINLTTDTTIISGGSTAALKLQILAPITNAPGVNATLTLSDVTTTNGLIVVLAGQSTFNGNIIVGGSPGDTLQLGVNNALPATAPLTLSGIGTATNTTIFDLNGYSTFISSLVFSSATYPGFVTNSSATPSTFGISNNAADLVQYGVIADNGALGGTLSLLKTGSGNLILSNANTYSGTTTISNGTLALTSTGSINNSSNIVIAAGGTFDVSAISSYTISTNLSASGTASAATIKGASSGTVSLGSHTVTLTYDGSDPALNISQGTLALNNNTFTVNGPVLTNGSYTLVQQTSGSITHTGTLALSGSAIPSSGTSNSISVSGNKVTLTIVENTTTTCALAMGSNPSCFGDPLVFTATVANNGTTGTTPTGSVIFKDGTTPLFTNTLSGGSAGYTTTTLSDGTSGIIHSITAYYQGDTYHNTSNSSGTPLSQTVDAPPVITTQPVSMTNSSALTTATLSVVATGTAPLSYQWYFNTSTQLPGATSSSLTLTSTQMITNSGVYDVVVSNGCGSTTSSFAIFLITNNIETLKANDSVNTSSFTGTTNWTPATTIAPSNVNAFTNAYLTSTFLLRSPSGSANYNFAGYSLTVNTGGELSLKGYGTNTINNLIMAGGTIAQGVTGANPDIANLAGNINLTTDTTIISGGSTAALKLQILAPITNAPGVNATLTLSDVTTTNGLIVVLAAANTFSGGIIVTGSPGDTLQLGADYALPATAPLALTGISTPTNTTILDLNGHTTFISSLVFSNATYPGFVTNSSATPGTLAISNNADDLVQYGVIADNGALGGTLSLLKTGSGNLILSNANTYSGTTTVSSGALTLNGPGTSASLVVTNGATCYVWTTSAVLANTAAVSIGAGSQLYLTNGVNQTVENLALNGQWQMAGTWGSVNSQATYQTNYFSGTGILTVSGSGAPAFLLRPIKTVSVIGPSGSPGLTSLLWSSNLILSWPSNLTGWQLQAQTNGLESSNWFDVSGSTATNQVIIPIDPANKSVFFRLTTP